jgi:hypothetical protein
MIDQQLVKALEKVLEDWSDEHDDGMGSALEALDALGYTVGRIFSQAPDIACRENGRAQFLAALDVGLGKEVTITLN